MSEKTDKQLLHDVVAIFGREYGEGKTYDGDSVGGRLMDEIREHLNNKTVPSKGLWEPERSSGFLGFRCAKCSAWVYAHEELVCDCDNRSRKRK